MADTFPQLCTQIAGPPCLLEGFTALMAAAGGRAWPEIARNTPIELFDHRHPETQAKCFLRGYLICPLLLFLPLPACLLALIAQLHLFTLVRCGPSVFRLHVRTACVGLQFRSNQLAASYCGPWSRAISGPRSLNSLALFNLRNLRRWGAGHSAAPGSRPKPGGTGGLPAGQAMQRQLGEQ